MGPLAGPLFFTSDPALAVFAESMDGGRAIPAIP